MTMVFQFCSPHYHLGHFPEEMSFVMSQVVMVDFLRAAVAAVVVAAVVVDQEVVVPGVEGHDEAEAGQVVVDRVQPRRAGQRGLGAADHQGETEASLA